MAHLGQYLKQRREAMFPSLEVFLKELNRGINLGSDHAFKAEDILVLESSVSVSSPQNNRISTSALASIADALKLDFDALLNNKIENEKTVEEILEYFDEGGTGSYEQRIGRLVAHCVISAGRGREILKTSIWDNYHGLPPVKTTGCNCLACKEYCAQFGELKHG